MGKIVEGRNKWFYFLNNMLTLNDKNQCENIVMYSGMQLKLGHCVHGKEILVCAINSVILSNSVLIHLFLL